VRNTKQSRSILKVPLIFFPKIFSFFLLLFVFTVKVDSLRCQENVLGVESGRNFYHFSMNDTGNYVSNVSKSSGHTSFLEKKGSGTNDHYAEQTGKGSDSSFRLGVHYAFGSSIQKGLQNQGTTSKRREGKALESITEAYEHNKTKSENPKWYIGLGIGQTASFFNFYEFSAIPSGGKIGKLHSLHIDFLYAINKRWMFESGIAQKAIVPPGYISSIGGKPEAGMTIVPIRVNYVINLSPREVDLMIFAGYSQGMKFGQFSFGFLSSDIDAVGDYYGNPLFPLVDLGARVKFTLGRIHLGVFASYSQGFKEIYRIQVVDMANVASGFPKLITGNGSHLTFGLSAYYAVFGRKNK